MSAYGAGKMAEGIFKIGVGIVICIAVVTGIFSAFAAHLGPHGCAITAAVVTYLAAAFLTGNLVTSQGQRLWTIPAAALGGAAGDWMYLNSGGGLTGSLLAAVVTASACGVLVLLAYFAGALFYTEVVDKK